MASALTAVDMQYLAGDEEGPLKIEHRIDDIRHLAHVSDRMQCIELRMCRNWVHG